MRDKNKYIDEFLESKLRTSRLDRTSGDFTQHLMKRITAENKSLVEERKGDRIVKYAIGSFSFLILGFTLLLGFVSGSGGSKTTEGTGIGFNTVQTSSSFIESLLYYVQSFFVGVLNFFGLSLSPGSVTIMLVVVLVVVIFLAGECLFLRGRYKSSIQLK